MIRVKCRQFEGVVITLEQDIYCMDMLGEHYATYRLVLRQNTGETIEIENLHGYEIEVINAKTDT